MEGALQSTVVRTYMDEMTEELLIAKRQRRDERQEYRKRKREEEERDGITSSKKSRVDDDNEEESTDDEEQDIRGLHDEPEPQLQSTSTAQPPPEFTGREGRRAMLEYQKRIRDLEEAAKLEASLRQRDEARVRTFEQKQVLEETKRRQALDEEHFRRLEKIDAEITRLSILRCEPIGLDRSWNRFWVFPQDPGLLYIESTTNHDWSYYGSVSDLEELYAYLNDKGVREKALRRGLSTVYPLLSQAMRKKQNELKRNDDGRHSSRLKMKTTEDSFKEYYNRWSTV